MDPHVNLTAQRSSARAIRQLEGRLEALSGNRYLDSVEQLVDEAAGLAELVLAWDPEYLLAAVRLGRIMLLNAGMEDESGEHLNEFGKNDFEKFLAALSNSSVWESVGEVANNIWGGKED